jgi:hypothetical protein
MKEDTCLTMGILSLFEVKTFGNDCPNSLIPKQPAVGNNYYLSLIPKQPSVGNDCFFLLLNETTNDCPFLLFRGNCCR